MRAYVLNDFASPPELKDIPEPQPGRGMVKVKIHACGLNFADLLMARGEYQERPPLPLVLGLELAGEVVALGEGVTEPAPGTRVLAFAGGGGLAEWGVFPADRVLPIPQAMPFEVAAGFAVAYGTSHLALTHRGRLRAGETLLVLGAAGGVGLTAVEIGAALGARVVAMARGEEKLAVAKAAGASVLIDSETPDPRAAFKGLGGIDVVYDTVGEPLASAALRALRPEGRHLIIGFAGGKVPQLPANLLLVKNIEVIGVYWGAYASFAPRVLFDSLREMLAWYEQGRIRPHIGQMLPLDRVAEGFALLRERKATGKIVIRIAT